MFQSFLSLMSAIIPPLAGVIIAAYWVIGKGKRENFELKKGLSDVYKRQDYPIFVNTFLKKIYYFPIMKIFRLF